MIITLSGNFFYPNVYLGEYESGRIFYVQESVWGFWSRTIRRGVLVECS